eukprot:7234908-Prymnesium_polylepis.1
MSCFLTRFLKAARAQHTARGVGGATASGPAGEAKPNSFKGFDVVHFNFGGAGGARVGADVYLTSFEGAASELRRLCKTGITNGFDFMTNGEETVLTVGSAATHALFARKNAPSGGTSVVLTTRHFNYSELEAMRHESALWPTERCLQWAGVE